MSHSYAKSEVLEQTNIFRSGLGWTKPVLEFQEQQAAPGKTYEEESGEDMKGLKKKEKKTSQSIRHQLLAREEEKEKRGETLPQLWPS